MPKRTFYLVDAFTDRAFCGNPCAVIPEADGLSDVEMQCIARETNAPETAFVFSANVPADADVRVRYFMPRQEIPFAGHPTIATGFLLNHLGRFAAGCTARFAFNIGTLPVDILPEGSASVVMSQPVPIMGENLDTSAIARALHLTGADLLEGLPARLVRGGVSFAVMPVADVTTLHNITMNRDALGPLLDAIQVNAIYVFAPHGIDPQADFHARLLDPFAAGEDPYTGSAAGCLAAYVHAHGLSKKNSIMLEQGHVLHRPGTGMLTLHKNNGALVGLQLGGTAIVTAKGVLNW